MGVFYPDVFSHGVVVGQDRRGSSTAAVATTFEKPDLTPDFSALPWDIDPEPDESSKLTAAIGTGIELTPQISAGIDEFILFEHGGKPAIPELNLYHHNDGAYFEVTTGLDLAQNVAGLTVAMVLRFKALSPDSQFFRLETGDGSNTGRVNLQSRNGTVRIGGRRLDADSFSSDESAGGQFTQKTWYRLIGVWDWQARTATAYLDGVQVAQTTTLGSSAGNTENTASDRGFWLYTGNFTVGANCRTRGLWGWQSAEDAAAIDTELQKITP